MLARMRTIGWGLAALLALSAVSCEEAPPPPPAVPLAASPLERAAALAASARKLLEARKFQEAEVAARESARLYWEARGPSHVDTRRAGILLATIRFWLRDERGAGQAIQAVLPGGPAPDPYTSFVVRDLEGLASAAEALDAKAAESALGQVLALRRLLLGPSHPQVVESEVALGRVLLRLCRTTEAEALLRDALAIAERTSGPTSPAVVEPLRKLADARWQASDDAGSVELLTRAASVLEPLEATEATRLVDVLSELAWKARRRRDLVAATALGERAVAVAQRRGHGLAQAADGLAQTLRTQGDDAKVLALFAQWNLVERTLPAGAADPGGPSLENVPRCTAPPDLHEGSVSNASAVVMGMAAGFRRCYNQALRADPNFRASLRVEARIAAAGDIVRVRTVVPAIYPEPMILCLMDRVRSARFAPPTGGGATIVIPITFVSQ
jgi:hypothetical protein